MQGKGSTQEDRVKGNEHASKNASNKKDQSYPRRS